MNDLIEALTIIRKYFDAEYPTNCSHDELRVCCDTSQFSSEDLARLDALGFFVPDPSDGSQGLVSFRFGSC